MEKSTPAIPDLNIDVEKAIPISEQSQSPPGSNTTWESQTDTLEASSIASSEEDSDTENAHQNNQLTIAVRLWRAVVPKALFSTPKKPFRTIVRKLEQCQDGYPYLASFLDSNENFMIYRRFGFLHARLLLQKQDELRVLEADLDRMDQRDKFNNVEALKCRAIDEERTEPDETRKDLLRRIKESVLEYDELLLKARELAGSSRPPERDYNSVANFIRHKKPLLEGDDDFIYNKEDLITLRPGRENAWLDAAIEKGLKLLPRSAVKYAFCSKETALKTKDDGLFLPTKSRVDCLVSFLIMIWVLVLLIVPVYFLSHIGATFSHANASTSNAICMGILLVATLLFAAALALFTKAKRHELLGASAGYCALLVVFIANLGINPA